MASKTVISERVFGTVTVILVTIGLVAGILAVI